MSQGIGKPQHHCIFGRVHIVALPTIPKNTSESNYLYWDVSREFVYDGFCDDFGPMNLGTIFEFCRQLDRRLNLDRTSCLAIASTTDPRDITNAAFLLGAYMMIRFSQTPSKLAVAFAPIRDQLVAYRDVSPGEQNFHLHLEDCWQGVWRARELGWVEFGAQGFDVEEYLHYDDPLNADLHQVVPGKFVAMKGPRSLPRGKQWWDREDGYRDFSPGYYIEILQEFGVQVVVRLNEPQYDAEDFTMADIAVADLRFEDCTNPPPEIEAKFLAIAEGVPGLLAVHCKAGLGRTGTLIALYLMKHWQFTARQAMGWLRVVRPGSVIGSQQQHLCEREAVMLRAGAAAAAASSAGRHATPAAVLPPATQCVPLLPTRLPPGAGPGDVMNFVAAVVSESVTSLDARGLLLHPRRPSAAAGGSGSGSGSGGSGSGECSPSSKEGGLGLTGLTSSALAVHVTEAMQRRNRRRSSPTHYT